MQGRHESFKPSKLPISKHHADAVAPGAGRADHKGVVELLEVSRRERDTRVNSEPSGSS